MIKFGKLIKLQPKVAKVEKPKVEKGKKWHKLNIRTNYNVKKTN